MNLNKRSWIKVATIGALSAAVLIGCGKKKKQHLRLRQRLNP